MGLKDHSMVLNTMISKVATNLKVYGACEDIILATLTLFQVFHLLSPYRTGQLTTPNPFSKMKARGKTQFELHLNNAKLARNITKDLSNLATGEQFHFDEISTICLI